jgi:hypothetical protein
LLGPALPDHPPAGTVAQEGFVRTALTLAIHVRAHSWAEADLGTAGVTGQADMPHAGERQAADAFDVLGRLMLPNSPPEGWTATLVTDLARGDEKVEAAVKLGKYIFHPTFLAIVDDTTRMVGEALHNLNVEKLTDLIHLLRHYAGTAPPTPPELQLVVPLVIEEPVCDPTLLYFPGNLPDLSGEAEGVFRGTESTSSLDDLDDDHPGIGLGDLGDYDDPGRGIGGIHL